MKGKRDTWSKAGQSFVTFTDAKGKETRKDILEKERLEHVRQEAEASEQVARRNWELCRSRNLRFGFDYEWLDKTFEHKGEPYRIAGLVVVDEDPVIVCIHGDRFARMAPAFVKRKLEVAHGL